jgi:hypothetical protein
MLDQLIWWGGIALELLILLRGFQEGLVRRYPIFYCYIFSVLLQEVIRFITLEWNRAAYSYIYWLTEFATIVIGCGIVFETYRTGLAAYPGAARMTRWVLSFVFALAFAKALADASRDPGWWAEATVTEVQRALRGVEAVSIVVLVALLLFYSIPLGRNLRGILLGYGLFVGSSTIWLAFAYPHGNGFRNFWRLLYPLSYFLALCSWAGYLWSYRANPHPKASVDLEQEYQRIAIATQRKLQEVRGHLRKAVRL